VRPIGPHSREGSAPPRPSSRTKEKRDIVEQLDVDLCDRRPGVLGHVGERLGHDEGRGRPRVAPGPALNRTTRGHPEGRLEPPSERIAGWILRAISRSRRARRSAPPSGEPAPSSRPLTAAELPARRHEAPGGAKPGAAGFHRGGRVRLGVVGEIDSSSTSAATTRPR
jgi:hypothetical protein